MWCDVLSNDHRFLAMFTRDLGTKSDLSPHFPLAVSLNLGGRMGLIGLLFLASPLLSLSSNPTRCLPERRSLCLHLPSTLPP